MKRHLETLFIIVVILSVCSCAPKSEVRPTQAPPGPPGDVSGIEAASYRAEAAAKKAEDSANETRSAVTQVRAAAERAEKAAKRSEDFAAQAREAAERGGRTAKQSEDSAAQAREAAERAGRAGKQSEDFAAKAREAAERAEKAEREAKRCEDSATQAREAADRAERATRRAEALVAGKPAPVPPTPLPPKPPEPPVQPMRTEEAEWRYEKEAIRLHLKSDPQLNLYQRSPHTLVLCVYHLRDPNAFNQLLEEKEGLWKLLECGRFDPSVTFSKRVVIQPGQELTELLDRPEGGKYVGLAAGYYLLQKERVVRLFPIPVISEKKGSTIFLKPGRLNIDLYMGPQEIQDLK